MPRISRKSPDGSRWSPAFADRRVGRRRPVGRSRRRRFPSPARCRSARARRSTDRGVRGSRVGGLPRLIADRWTDAHVIQIGGITPASDDASVDASSTRITYSAATSVAERHALLTVEGPFDALIDLAHDDVDPQLSRLRKTLFHVRRHGFYIARTDVDPSGGQPFADAIARMLTVGARLVRGRRRPCAVTTLPM